MKLWFILLAGTCLGFIIGLNTHRFLIRSVYRFEDVLEVIAMLGIALAILTPAVALLYVRGKS